MMSDLLKIYKHGPLAKCIGVERESPHPLQKGRLLAMLTVVCSMRLGKMGCCGTGKREPIVVCSSFIVDVPQGPFRCIGVLSESPQTSHIPLGVFTFVVDRILGAKTGAS